eukprot:12475061-Heterocapsa_arctica.AAC.1
MGSDGLLPEEWRHTANAARPRGLAAFGIINKGSSCDTKLGHPHPMNAHDQQQPVAVPQESDTDQEEPNRNQRIGELMRAQLRQHGEIPRRWDVLPPSPGTSDIPTQAGDVGNADQEQIETGDLGWASDWECGGYNLQEASQGNPPDNSQEFEHWNLLFRLSGPM